MSYILCFYRNKNTPCINKCAQIYKFIKVYISIHDGHGLMMMYDIHMHLDSFNTITSDGLEYITTFNIDTHKIIHIVCAYKIHSCSIFKFLINLQIIIQHSFEHCLIIIMGNFNVDILKNNNRIKTIKFHDKFQLQSQFNESTTKAGSQLNHVWANVSRIECKFGVTKTYWSIFHKLIYITFKLPNTLLMYNKKNH